MTLDIILTPGTRQQVSDDTLVPGIIQYDSLRRMSCWHQVLSNRYRYNMLVPGMNIVYYNILRMISYFVIRYSTPTHLRRRYPDTWHHTYHAMFFVWYHFGWCHTLPPPTSVVDIRYLVSYDTICYVCMISFLVMRYSTLTHLRRRYTDTWYDMIWFVTYVCCHCLWCDTQFSPTSVIDIPIPGIIL